MEPFRGFGLLVNCHDSGVLVAVPLREDVESPWLAESDEQEWADDEEEHGDEEHNTRLRHTA